MEMKRDCDATDGAGAARMEPLAVLPVFLKLAGKRAVIVGGNEPALWKAELLAAAGAEVDVIALAAVRATREAMLRGEAGGLPSIVGVAAPGEWADGREFDGITEIALFPGDLPSNAASLFKAGATRRADGSFRALRFRPPKLEATEDGTPALPHIRLDRALQFLIGDRMR
jgi:predicted YcjX-like family ATPase